MHIMLIHRHIPKHVGYKAWTLDLQLEVPVKDPGVTPALSHVLHELPGGEVLADPMGNNLALIFSIGRQHVQKGQG